MKFGPEGHIVQLSCSPLGDLREAIQLNSYCLAPRPRADCRKSGGFHPAGIGFILQELKTLTTLMVNAHNVSRTFDEKSGFYQ